MKKLYGHSANIDSSIVGKITSKLHIGLRKKDLILISSKRENGYGGIITNQPYQSVRNSKNGTPMLCDVKGVESLKDGDVVLIEPNGTINVLYEKNASQNSLMLTERCNCSCIMCPQPPIAREDDKTPLNLRIISLMDKKTLYLGLTGGEPTLLEDRLIHIIDTCKRRLPKTELNLLTNGIRFENFKYVEKLASAMHPHLTIDIPLYADTDTMHNDIVGVNGFYKTIKGLYNLALFKQKIGIRIVIIKANYKRLLYLAKFIYHNFPFVLHVAFMQMETMGLAKDNIGDLWIDPFDYNKELEETVTYLARRDMNVSIYNAQLCILPNTIKRFARQSISAWKNVYIDECDNCDCKDKCAGLFASSKEKHSVHIRALKGGQ